MLNISIVGVGRLGGALALALDRAGFAVEDLVYRRNAPSPDLIGLFRRKPSIMTFDSPIKIASDVILITTQDAAIRDASKQLAAAVSGSPSVFITSGSLPSSYIADLRRSGCRIGSIHPLVSVSDPVLGADRFRNAYFCLEGDAEAFAHAKLMIDSLEGHSFTIASDKKPLYHAAAVTTSGHVTALIDTALEMLVKCGLDNGVAAEVLLPLLESTVENLKEQGVEKALTGPFARGDKETFELHIDALTKNMGKDEIETYLNLAKRSLEIAGRSTGVNKELDDLQKQVSMAKKDLR